MNVDFSALADAVTRMGDIERAPPIEFKPQGNAIPDFIPALKRGIEIAIGELDDSNDIGGLLGYRGAQVLLYIKAAHNSPAEILDDAKRGPRFHLAECSTIREMRAQNRIDRYVVTNELSGRFPVVWRHDESDAATCRLLVCQNCLKQLNYQNSRFDTAARHRIVERFDLATFFSTYSTLFRHQRGIDGLATAIGRQTPEERAAIVRAGCRCDACAVHLPNDVDLLASTHSNVDDTSADGRILCVDCRRKPPVAERLAVSRDAMRTIATVRRENWKQRETEYGWEDAYVFADQAFHGLMKIYERQGHAVPEPGLELMDERGAVSVELGLAWSVSKHAVVLQDRDVAEARRLGWDVMTLGEALLDSREDG